MQIALMFLLGWIVTLVPVWLHQVPTFWLWGALSGSVLAFAACLAAWLSPRRSAPLMIAGCAVLISLAARFDFWRLPPAFILAQCRAYTSGGMASDLVRHMETHWTWFFATNVAMLVWIWAMPFAGIKRAVPALPPAQSVRSLHRYLLPRLSLSMLMFMCMVLTMTMFETFARALRSPLSADGFVSAMLCGMALYHIFLQLLASLTAFLNLDARYPWRGRGPFEERRSLNGAQQQLRPLVFSRPQRIRNISRYQK